jgi:protein-S-isoprenylcysteine O-methyltransferase Ste14
MTPELAIYLIWAAWGLSWVLASRWASSPVKRPGSRTETSILAIVFTGFFVAFVEGPSGARSTVLWRAPEALQWAMVAVTLAAFAFAWWARLRMGPLWSVTAQAKAYHRIIDDGPFALVRHPIYFGLILGVAARAGAKGTSLSLWGLAMVAGGFWLKARIEERFLAETLGREAYAAYAARVRRLIPFIL